MVILNLNGILSPLSKKRPCNLPVGETKTFANWEAFADYGRAHTLNESNFDIKPLQDGGFELKRVKL